MKMAISCLVILYEVIAISLIFWFVLTVFSLIVKDYWTVFTIKHYSRFLDLYFLILTVDTLITVIKLARFPSGPSDCGEAATKE